MTLKARKTKKQIPNTMRLLRTIHGLNAASCAAAVFLGFLAASLILAAVGRNASGLFQAIMQAASGYDPRRGTWNARYIGEWLVVSLPVILCGLSMGFSIRCGLFNLGAEGQYTAGLTAAQIAALSFSRSFGADFSAVNLSAAVLCAMAAGALLGAAAGFLKAQCRIPEILTTVLMNYAALYVHRLVTLKIPGSIIKTPDFSASLSSPFLAALTNNSKLNNGLWITFAAVVIFWLILEKSSFGFSLRAAGAGIDAARFAGGNVSRRIKINITAAMAVSGAFAGLAGAVVSLGMFTHGRVLATFDGYGFIGIAAALCGNCTALGTAIMGFLFGILNSARPLLQSRQIPGEIVFIIIGLIVVFNSMTAPAIRALLQPRPLHKLFGKKNYG